MSQYNAVTVSKTPQTNRSNTIRNLFNRHFDRFIRPEAQIFRFTRSAFLLCGYVGLFLAVLLTMLLVRFLGLVPWVMGVASLTAVCTFLSLAMLTKIIMGEEHLVYYHHQNSVLVMVALVLWLLKQPILPYLDMVILGVGLFSACGRVGCLMVGCCHGRPHRWGVCYREEHVAAGFTPYYAGVRLFPIQACESLWVFGTVAVGSLLVLLNGHIPGEALAWFIVSYGIGRFTLEFFRGDPVRMYLWGFSEAQWDSLILILGVAALGWFGLLPFQQWHTFAALVMALVIITVALKRHFQKPASHRLLHPYHVQELAGALEHAANLAEERCNLCEQDFEPANIHIFCTRLGIQISATKIKEATGPVTHFVLSSQNDPLYPEGASILTNLIQQLQPQLVLKELISGNQNVYHLLFQAKLA
jgi:hypothetical protein